MESFRLVLREGFLPQWSTETLERALVLLEKDDPFLTQGSTCTPPPLMCVQDWRVEACDLIGFCSIPNAREATVGEVEEGFARSCFEADQRLGEPAACRWWLNHWDDSPRLEVFAVTAQEFRDEIARRIRLDPDLQEAVKRQPDDLVLRRACFDWMVENGASDEWAKAESGWRG